MTVRTLLPFSIGVYIDIAITAAIALVPSVLLIFRQADKQGEAAAIA